MSKFVAVLLAALVLSVPAVSLSESEWLSEPEWNDRPAYVEDITLSYSATDLVTEKNTRQVCTSYTNTTTENGTVNRTCDSFGNEFYEAGKVEVLDFTAVNEEYLGNGVVRSNLSIGSTEIVLEVLKADTFLSSDPEFRSWFNERYYYGGGNITGSQVDELRSKVKSAAVGDNSRVLAARVNGFSVDSLDPFTVSADVTAVIRFEDYRSSGFTVADLVSVEVESGAAN